MKKSHSRFTAWESFGMFRSSFLRIVPGRAASDRSSARVSLPGRAARPSLASWQRRIILCRRVLSFAAESRRSITNWELFRRIVKRFFRKKEKRPPSFESRRSATAVYMIFMRISFTSSVGRPVASSRLRKWSIARISSRFSARDNDITRRSFFRLNIEKASRLCFLSSYAIGRRVTNVQLSTNPYSQNIPSPFV